MGSIPIYPSWLLKYKIANFLVLKKNIKNRKNKKVKYTSLGIPIYNQRIKKKMIQAAINNIIGTGIGIIGAGVGISVTCAFTLLPYIVCISVIIGVFMIISWIKFEDETDLTDIPMPGVRCPLCYSRGIET